MVIASSLVVYYAATRTAMVPEDVGAAVAEEEQGGYAPLSKAG